MKLNSISLAVVLAVSSMLTTTAWANSSPKVAIEAVNQEFEAAMSAASATRLAGVYTSNGQALPPNGSTISGRENIRAFWQGVIGLGIASVDLDSVELEVLGETAIEVGKFVLKTVDGTVADTGKYIVVWKKDNGEWLWHRHIWNSSNAAE